MIPGAGAPGLGATGHGAPAAAGAAEAAPGTAPPVPGRAPVSLGEAIDRMIHKVGGWVEKLVLHLPNPVVAILPFPIRTLDFGAAGGGRLADEPRAWQPEGKGGGGAAAEPSTGEEDAP